ncbi:MAG: radical SAM protein [Elusimicrobia bacterium]|nr:radical SAM protein [Elusimicrobiota bacterium]
MLKNDDDLSWYARKAARASAKPGTEPESAHVERIRDLLERLRAAGVRGDAATMTLFTRQLPPGCRPCLRGDGTNLYVTGLCTRDCFFCFNQKPRQDELVVHGLPVREPEEAAGIVTRFGLKSVGLSGGEPLLRPERVLRLLRVLRALPEPPRVDLYTNGDLADDATLKALKDAGLDSIRFDAAARGYDLAPVARARAFFDEVAVEIPLVPEDLPKVKEMARALDRLRVPYLNVHELFLCVENEARVLASGARPKEGGESKHLLWRPTSRSLEACLELLLFALDERLTTSVYLCSCGTQETISRRGYLKRRRGSGAAAAA